MSEERFIDREADDFERALLSSARRDGMSPEKKRALAIALGAGGATLTVTSAAAGAAAGTGKAGAVVAAKTKATLGVVALAKWVAGIALVSAVVVGAGHGAIDVYREHRAQGSSGTPVAAARSPATEALAATPSPPAEPPAAPVEPPAAPTSGAPARQLSPRGPAPSRAPALAHGTARPRLDPAAVSRGSIEPPPRAEAAPLAPRSALAEELRAIERARSAITAGDLVEATRALDAHAAAFPSGALSDEARILRIDVLARRGDHRGAEAAARAFLASRPRSPHAPRLRELLGEAL